MEVAWASRISESWVAIRSAGLSDVPGSCGMYDTVPPRSRRSSPSFIVARSRPSMRIAPPPPAPPAAHRAAAADVAEQRHPDGRLARARLADEAEHLARVDLQADLVDDVDVRPGQLDLQVVDVDRRRPDRLCRAHDLPPRSRPMAARATPSVTRLVPTVSRPMASTGRKTDHGWIPMASRFSLIIRPQSAVGGWRPKPRKLTAATRLIEYVMRRPISTSSGLVTFGSSSPVTIRQRFSPTTSAALMKSRSTTSWPAPRITRATRGAWVKPTVRTISHSFGPTADTASSTKMIAGNDSSTSLPRMSTSSSQLRE